jgi:hypothetical protein
MTAPQRTAAKQIARKLHELSDSAARHGLELGNGGDVGSLLGTIASDLELQAKGHEEGLGR